MMFMIQAHHARLLPHWDAPFISWLENNGYEVDYCTDYDIDEDPDFLTPYCMLLV